MTKEERMVIIRDCVIAIEKIDKSLPAFERISQANELIDEADKKLFPEDQIIEKYQTPDKIKKYE